MKESRTFTVTFSMCHCEQTEVELLQEKVGDNTVSEQINNAVAQKSLVQFITWEEND